MDGFVKLKAYAAGIPSVVAVALLPLALWAQTSDPVLDPRDFDTNTPACTDFYQFANGGWVAQSPVPAAYPFWGSFNELQSRNDEALRDLLTEAPRQPSGPTEQKVRLFYAACMNADDAERPGAGPPAPPLTGIDAIADQAGLQAEIARLHDQGLAPLFSLGSAPDPQDSSRVIAHLGQDGLGLPDRDYYTRGDDTAAQTRRAYVEHI